MKNNIFSKTTPEVLSKRQAGLNNRISVITHMTDAVGWRPVEYEMPDRIQHFLAGLEGNATRFLDSTKPDMYNARFYTATISHEIQVALTYLEREHIRNRKNINGIREYQNAVRNKLKTRLDRLQNELERINR